MINNIILIINYNNNSKELTNYPWHLDIPNPQQYYSFSSNQGHITHEQQHQQKNQEKKSRGNRKLQWYRRKLRKQGINTDAIARSEQQNIQTINSLIDKPVIPQPTTNTTSKKHTKIQQRSTTMKTKTIIKIEFLKLNLEDFIFRI